MGEITTKGKAACIVEYVFGIIFILLGAIGLRSIAPAFAFGPLCFGIFFILCGIIWTQLRRTCQKYSTLLSSDPNRSIDNLATSTNSPASTVRSNIELMIKKGLIKNVAIDSQRNCVVVGPATNDNEPLSNQAIAHDSTSETVVVECDGCGAKNSIQKGKAAICEHCGTSLNA